MQACNKNYDVVKVLLGQPITHSQAQLRSGKSLNVQWTSPVCWVDTYCSVKGFIECTVKCRRKSFVTFLLSSTLSIVMGTTMKRFMQLQKTGVVQSDHNYYFIQGIFSSSIIFNPPNVGASPFHFTHDCSLLEAHVFQLCRLWHSIGIPPMSFQ